MEIFLDNHGRVSEQTIRLTDMNHAHFFNTQQVTVSLEFQASMRVSPAKYTDSTDLSGEIELLQGAWLWLHCDFNWLKISVWLFSSFFST